MGYYTRFIGEINVDPPFSAEEMELLTRLAHRGYNGSSDGLPKMPKGHPSNDGHGPAIAINHHEAISGAAPNDVIKSISEDEFKAYGEPQWLEYLFGKGGIFTAEALKPGDRDRTLQAIREQKEVAIIDQDFEEAIRLRDQENGLNSNRARTFTGTIKAFGEDNTDIWRIVGVGSHCEVQKATITWPES